MDADEFRRQMNEEFAIPKEARNEAMLRDVIASYDSLKRLELIAFIEEEAGFEVGQVPDEIPIIDNIQDAIDYFGELTATTGAAETAG